MTPDPVRLYHCIIVYSHAPDLCQRRGPGRDLWVRRGMHPRVTVVVLHKIFNRLTWKRRMLFRAFCGFQVIYPLDMHIDYNAEYPLS